MNRKKMKPPTAMRAISTSNFRATSSLTLFIIDLIALHSGLFNSLHQSECYNKHLHKNVVTYMGQALTVARIVVKTCWVNAMRLR
jgi:hypothetical protein